MNTDVRAFPFDSLDVLTRADIDAAARLRRFARDHVRLGELEAAFSELLGEPLRILVKRYRRMDPARALDGVGVLVAAADAPALASSALLELEGALAAVVVARALRQRAPRIVDPAKPLPPPVIGALAAVLVSAARRAHVGRALRVLAAGPASALARDLAAAERDVTSAWLTVVVGADAYQARVSVPDRASSLAALRTAPLMREGLVALGDAPLALPLVLASTLARREDVQTLAAGDAFVVASPPSGRRHTNGAGGALLGPIALVAATAEVGLGGELAEGGRLVLRGGPASHPWSPEPVATEQAMTQHANSTHTIDVLEDVPVVVRVELGVVEMKAREWADLGPGDVVTLGRKLGDPAILRVGGVEVARGELVQVDGQYAVRIVARGAGG